MHISQVWNSLAWHEKWLAGEVPKAYHFFNDKPWTMSPAKYPDLKIWYSAAEELHRKYPGAAEAFDLCLGNPKFMEEFKQLQGHTADAPQLPMNRSQEEALMSPLSADESKMSWADLDEAEWVKSPIKRDEETHRSAPKTCQRPGSNVIIAERTIITHGGARHQDQHVSLRPNVYKTHDRRQGHPHGSHSHAPRSHAKGGRDTKVKSPDRWVHRKPPSGAANHQERSDDNDPKGFSGGHWQRVGGGSKKREDLGHNADRWHDSSDRGGSSDRFRRYQDRRQPQRERW